jgi:hypothetical protein
LNMVTSRIVFSETLFIDIVRTVNLRLWKYMIPRGQKKCYIIHLISVT